MTTEITKGIEIQRIIITKVSAIIETIIREVEPTVITGTILIKGTITADQAQDTQTAVTQDNNHHTTEIIITITIIDKDTDNVLIVTTMLIEMIEETRHKENKITDITLESDAQMEINTIITTRTELIT